MSGHAGGDEPEGSLGRDSPTTPRRSGRQPSEPKGSPVRGRPKDSPGRAPSSSSSCSKTSRKVFPHHEKAGLEDGTRDRSAPCGMLDRACRRDPDGRLHCDVPAGAQEQGGAEECQPSTPKGSRGHCLILGRARSRSRSPIRTRALHSARIESDTNGTSSAPCATLAAVSPDVRQWEVCISPGSRRKRWVQLFPKDISLEVTDHRLHVFSVMNQMYRCGELSSDIWLQIEELIFPPQLPLRSLKPVSPL